MTLQVQTDGRVITMKLRQRLPINVKLCRSHVNMNGTRIMILLVVAIMTLAAQSAIWSIHNGRLAS